ncbi:MAG: hypothetical protein BJ554DRAFT_3833, partial [Olpidium bornovanus]
LVSTAECACKTALSCPSNPAEFPSEAEVSQQPGDPRQEGQDEGVRRAGVRTVTVQFTKGKCLFQEKNISAYGSSLGRSERVYI